MIWFKQVEWFDSIWFYDDNDMIWVKYEIEIATTWFDKTPMILIMVWFLCELQFFNAYMIEW